MNVGKEKIIKIGQSKDTNTMEKHRNDMSRTSAVPELFEIYYYAEISNYKNLEKEIQKYLYAYRVNKKREFFQIDTEKARK
ncbi:T5orf172 domain-containing protein [Brevinema andersonii]|uniref:T5orf172 domain-containing protein n=2 Tax=Brevinema andersonii TaxID=34097 RepID=A0A1I1D6A5_BREAD|nr:T5orf172 domain-containing protein [Brevinema andersonii]